MPAKTPIGMLMADATPTMIPVPTRALRKPPPGSPTGAGICVKNDRLT